MHWTLLCFHVNNIWMIFLEYIGYVLLIWGWIDIKVYPVPPSVLLLRKRIRVLKCLEKVFRNRLWPQMAIAKWRILIFLRSAYFCTLVQMFSRCETKRLKLDTFLKNSVAIVIPFALFYCLQNLTERNRQLIQEKEDILYQIKQRTENWREEKVKKQFAFSFLSQMVFLLLFPVCTVCLPVYF